MKFHEKKNIDSITKIKKKYWGESYHLPFCRLGIYKAEIELFCIYTTENDIEFR